MEKHAGDWKRAIVSGKVHIETEISVMKHEVVGEFGCYPKASKEIPAAAELEQGDTWLTNKGGPRGAGCNHLGAHKPFS